MRELPTLTQHSVSVRQTPFFLVEAAFKSGRGCFLPAPEGFQRGQAEILFHGCAVHGMSFHRFHIGFQTKAGFVWNGVAAILEGIGLYYQILPESTGVDVIFQHVMTASGSHQVHIGCHANDGRPGVRRKHTLVEVNQRHNAAHIGGPAHTADIGLYKVHTGMGMRTKSWTQ